MRRDRPVRDVPRTASVVPMAPSTPSDSIATPSAAVTGDLGEPRGGGSADRPSRLRRLASSRPSNRSRLHSSSHKPSSEPAARRDRRDLHRTLIPGDGIGPELADAAGSVLEATGIAFDWDVQEAGEADDRQRRTPLPPDRVIKSIRTNGVALKGPIATPVGRDSAR